MYINYLSLVITSTVAFGSKCAAGKYTVDLVSMVEITPHDKANV